jgi:hypothetical protein
MRKSYYDRCVFCGAAPTTKEDVLPKWLKKYLSVSPGHTHMTQRLEYTEGYYRDQPYTELIPKKKKTPAYTVKAVCKKTCNGGWMSQLETDAKPILLDMFSGKSLNLTPEVRTVISRWTAKTGMMFDFMYGREPSMTFRDDLRLRGTAPPNSTVVAAYINPVQDQYFSGSIGAQTHPSKLPSDEDVPTHGYVWAFGLAHLALLIMVLPGEERFPISPDAFPHITRLWPLEAQSAADPPARESWPPPEPVTAEWPRNCVESLRAVIGEKQRNDPALRNVRPIGQPQDGTK